MTRSTFLFSHWYKKRKADDAVIVSSLALNLETKISSDSLYPTILILPNPTLKRMYSSMFLTA